MARFPPLRAVFRPSVLVLLSIVALLIALRVALPFFLTHYLNRVLTEAPEYEGSVADVDVHLWRGAYSIHGVEVRQVKGNKITPLFNAQHIHLSVEWRELLHGSLVGEVEVIKPQVNIVAVPQPQDVKQQKFRLQDLVDRFTQFMPLNINSFTLLNGELRVSDVGASPPLDLFFDEIRLTARNLTNSERASDTLWATVSGTARAMGSGGVTLEMRLNPSEKRPTFDLAFELKELRLPVLNDYLKHYLAVEARDGRLSLYAETTARDGRFKGYVKPLVKDLDIIKVKTEKGPVEAIKGFFVKLLAQVFKNEPKEQVATKVQFAGAFENPEIGVWDAVIYFVRNAFVEALTPRFDESVAPRQAEKAQRAPAPPDGKQTGRGAR